MKIRSIEKGEFPRLLDLIREAFTHYGKEPVPEYGKLHEETFHEVYARTDLDPELIIVAEDDGRFVSMCSLLPKRLRFAGKELMTAVLSPVGTLPGYRGQGLAEQVISFALERAKEKGYALSHVLGHPTYYPRVGYVPVFPFHDVEMTAGTADGSRAASSRLAAASDLPQLMALYEGEHRRHLMNPVRTIEWWQRELLPTVGTRHSFAVKDPADFRVFTVGEAVIGYANLAEGQDALLLSECSLAASEHAEAVWHALLLEAERRQKPTLKGPYKNLPRLAAYLRLRGAKEISFAPSAWMMQVLDWETVLTAFASHACLASVSGVPLQLAYKDGALHAVWGDRVSQTAMSPAVLTQLMMGTFAPEELVKADELLALIFKKDLPYFNHNETLQ
ncbi:putative N-acetyltransferase YhbS [Tumebacillus sp. BK434]|uniref:GNAT family N-acetyltransferase n=1 Tax=Tumebacillus sp. BK434 TaxID=2512169 RepID=UPI00104DB11B|nr:GNAT family N-acetyltransferase [Tumebacillus sp. BK434]TCP52773.1 putative N-acetyltransferase YhbS [Tumebacillus sp. BK434]